MVVPISIFKFGKQFISRIYIFFRIHHLNGGLIVNKQSPYSYKYVLVDCESEEPSYDCGNGVCLKYEFVCDGNTDCRNRTDEINCSHYNTSLCFNIQ